MKLINVFVCSQYDKFREKFLWGRRPMLAAAAARLRDRHDLIWVDMGGGTGVSARRSEPVKGPDSLRFDHSVP